MSTADDKTKAYQELLRRYAASLNLVSRKVLSEIDKHIETSCAYGEAIPPGRHVLDVGSGAGLPGLPLAICRPDLQLTLAEARGKRAAFLDLATASLGLENVSVYNGDVRHWQGKTAFVTAQAVAPFDEVYRLIKDSAQYPLLLVSRKGRGWRREARRLGAQVFHVKPLADGSELVALRLQEER